MICCSGARLSNGIGLAGGLVVRELNAAAVARPNHGEEAIAPAKDRGGEAVKIE